MNGLTERHVQAVWYDSALRPARLVTRDGVAIKVVSPGEWNLGYGPDFRNAVIEIGNPGRRVVGDVEVHLMPSDWEHHGHGLDENYRNVIAHVTWSCGPDPQSLPTGAITIWIGRFLAGDQNFDPSKIDFAAYPYHIDGGATCPHPEKFSPNEYVACEALIKAGKRRLRDKAEIMRRRIVTTGGNSRQVYYEGVMRALGYSRNANQFENVAKRVPFDELPSEIESARSALLAAGSFEEWDRRNVRPNNSPEYRLSKAAEVFTASPIMDYSQIDSVEKTDVTKMVNGLCHGGCLGRGRASAIIANVIVPFAIATDNVSDVPDWLPPEDVSDAARLTAYRIFGRDHNAVRVWSNNDVKIQGLLDIRSRYCRDLQCEACYRTA